MKIKSSPRLKSFDYYGGYAYFLTICTYHKKIYFDKDDIVEFVLKILKEEADKLKFELFAYCFMPDHIHLLLLGSENSSLKDFMRIFKQKSSFYFKKKYGEKLWHLSYYDRILRKEDSLRDVAIYIFNNPVRKGLVENFKDYKFLGSFVFNVDEV